MAYSVSPHRRLSLEVNKSKPNVKTTLTSTFLFFLFFLEMLLDVIH